MPHRLLKCRFPVVTSMSTISTDTQPLSEVNMAKAPAARTATGYCMKCKTQRQIRDAKPITMKNGRPATEGTCPECGTRMFKIGASK
jgi:hypothetical protein